MIQYDASTEYAKTFSKLVYYWIQLRNGQEIDQQDYKVQWEKSAYYKWYITCQFGASALLDTRCAIIEMAQLIGDFNTEQEFRDWWKEWTTKLMEREIEIDNARYDTTDLLNRCLTA